MAMMKMINALLNRLDSMDLPEEQQEELNQLKEAVDNKDAGEVPPRTLQRLKSIKNGGGL